MQRKNYFLRNSTPKSKSGMAMIMAIMVIVVMATIMALSLSLTSQTTKRTTDIYLYEQAVLYSKSAAELALLDIAQNICQDTFNDTLGDAGEIKYDVNVTMLYVYTNNAIPSPCTNSDIYTTHTQVITPEQNGSVLMDITTTLHDPTIATEPIRYFRRSIQKL
ncbi:MAG: hypothetical protein J7J96_04965 [Sulfurimonas sp.]|nr:hypothetical protein [Sulfurimonas sp.]